MSETWRPIKGKEGQYEVSNLGNVRSLDRTVNNPANGQYRVPGKTLRLCHAKNGYTVVNLGRKTHYVHRLVCETFIGAIPNGMTVNHKNGDKSNNTVANLEIMSYQENHLHAFRELHRRPTNLGRLNTNASKQVAQIKDGSTIATYPSAREAERQTGVSHKGISACCHGSAKSAGGYRWAFASDIAEPNDLVCAQK